MNTAVIGRLILKDWRLNRLTISLAIAIGLAALVLVRYGSETARTLGSVWFFVALMVLGSMLPASTVVNERKKQTLAFIMSLPVTAVQYAIAKIVAIWAMFLVPWCGLVISAVVVIETGRALPHGLIPMLLILAMLPLVGFCIISSATLIGESEGALIAASLVCNSSYWFVWYLLTKIPTLTDNWKGALPVWNSAVRTVLLSEMATIAVILAITLLLQSRKRDFI
jgi:ABC-2 type transport system permease protein